MHPIHAHKKPLRIKGRHFDERDVRKEMGGVLDVTLVNEAFAQPAILG